jgi:DNA-binding NarL/FixJ family response regulator
MTRKIFLVDDHDVVRAGMKSVLDESFDIVGEAADVNEAVAGILATNPEMVVLDVKLPDGNGADVIERVRRTRPGVKFMALTVSTSRDDVVRLMQAGVDGYITKTTASNELPHLIDQTLEGQRPVSADVAAFMLDIDEDIEVGSTIQRLTPREREGGGEREAVSQPRQTRPCAAFASSLGTHAKQSTTHIECRDCWKG